MKTTQGDTDPQLGHSSASGGRTGGNQVCTGLLEKLLRLPEWTRQCVVRMVPARCIFSDQPSESGTYRSEASFTSLARASLLREWRKYLPAILAVLFSSLLITVQCGLVLGEFGTVSVVIDSSTADIWASFPGTASVDFARDIASKNDVFLRIDPDVKDLEHLAFGAGDWRREDGAPFTATLIGIDTRPGRMGLALAVSDELRAKLNEPQSVLVSAADLGKLEAKVGTKASINNQSARVVGIVPGSFRSIGGIYVITSLASMRRFSEDGRYDDRTSFFLVKAKPGVNIPALARRLEPNNFVNPYSLRTAATFSRESQLFWLLESGAGLGFLFSSVLGVAVGILVTSQTLASAINSSLREYATLRALGIPLSKLRRIVVEQSLLVGVVGVLASSVIAVLIGMLGRCFHLGITLSPTVLLVCALFALVAAVCAGLIAMRALYRAQPVTLLR